MPLERRHARARARVPELDGPVVGWHPDGSGEARRYKMRALGGGVVADDAAYLGYPATLFAILPRPALSAASQDGLSSLGVAKP